MGFLRFLFFVSLVNRECLDFMQCVLLSGFALFVLNLNFFILIVKVLQ
jgi:hypothetical protein